MNPKTAVKWLSWVVAGLLVATLGTSPAAAELDSSSLEASSDALEKVSAEMQKVAQRLQIAEQYKADVDAAMASGDKKRLEMLLKEGGATSVSAVPLLSAKDGCVEHTTLECDPLGAVCVEITVKVCIKTK